MTTLFRAPATLLRRVRDDLSRDHPFAAERVGFIACRAGGLDNGGLVVLASSYQPVADGDYVNDRRFGATMGPAAIRKALTLAYNAGTEDISIFHVHMHEHRGRPGFSRIDLAENAKFVPDFFNAAPRMPHGAIVLSRDQAFGLCWRTREARPDPIDRFVSVGVPVEIWTR